tara:strand:+ start:427 stop:927 length:501 start_codon:yes stop_codon:yes gene_type:complete
VINLERATTTNKQNSADRAQGLRYFAYFRPLCAIKTIMNSSLKIAVNKESEEELVKCLDFKNSKNIDSSQYDFIEKALSGKWHSQHEDIVNTIYVQNLKDDRFVEPILNIALNKEVFRPYDDELESTLRKCVHAFKTIDTHKANIALKRLAELNNNNVNSALEMYE